jgi:outer membrane autotransporter protein
MNGDVTGQIIVTASGGSVDTTDGNVDVNARTSAISGDVTGDVSGEITTIAIGGTATTESGHITASTEAVGISGSLTGDMSGEITSIAIGGTASTSNNSAKVDVNSIGIKGDMIGDLSGSILVVAEGGTITLNGDGDNGEDRNGPPPPNQHNSVTIANFTGEVISVAMPGLIIDGGETNLSRTTATAIQADDELYLNATAGRIYAIVAVPEGFTEDDLPSRSHATAIKGGDGNDTVLLSNVDIIGDINLGAGTNRLEILGDTYLDGDIGRWEKDDTDDNDGDEFTHVATAELLQEMEQSNYTSVKLLGGLFYPVGTVHVSGLGGQSLIVGEEGGLGVTLYNDVENELNSKLEVQGSVEAEEGASIAAFPATYDNCCDIIGQTYEVISADEGVTGEFVESEATIFEFDVTQTSNTVSITPTGVKLQDACCFSKAPIASADITMFDISKHAAYTRAMLRGTTVASTSDNRPQGAAGPMVRQLNDGEWVGFVRQFNDLGAQESEGSLTGYKWNTSGIMFGAEKMLQEHVIAGLVTSGAWTDLDGKDGGGGGNSEMMDVAAYGNYFSDTWTAEAGLFYGHADNTMQRIAIDSQLYEADYNSNIYGTWAEVGHLMPAGANNVEPYARLSYISGHHEGYTETGDGLLPLTIDANRTDNLNTELGARVDRNWMFENEKELRVELKAAWRHEMLDDTVTVNGSILGIDQTFNSPASARNSLALGIRTDWQINDTMSIGLEYEPTIACDWYNHSFGGTFTYQF